MTAATIELIGKIIVAILAIGTAYIGYKYQQEKNREARAKDAKYIQDSNAAVIAKIEESDKKQTESINSLLVNFNELQAKYSEIFVQFHHMQVQFKEMQSYIYELQTKISQLLEFNRNPSAAEKLIIKLRKNIDFLAQDTHKEIRRTLVNALEEVTPIISSILATDFANLNKETLYEDIKRKAVSMQPKINFKILNIKDKETFIEALAQAIKSDIRAFCNSVVNAATEFNNGDRIDALEKHAVELVTSVTEKTTNIYDTYKSK